MQNFTDGIIKMVNGRENGVILGFLTIIVLIACINSTLVLLLEKKRNKIYIPEAASIAKKIVIVLCLFSIVLIWFPFDWAKIVSRIIFVYLLLYPIFPFIFNKPYRWDPCILSGIAFNFYYLISHNSGMENQFWNSFFILINILILFLFISCYCVVLARNFVRNIMMLYRKNGDRLKPSKKSDTFLFRISKIGLIFSIALSYIVVVYSDDYFSDDFEKVFCFIAEAIIIPNIITLLLEIKNKNSR